MTNNSWQMERKDACGAAGGVPDDLRKVAQRMGRSTAHISVVVAVAVAVAAVVVSGRPAAQETLAATPLITSVQVDLAQQMLTINGLNFGTTAPTVSLALTPMTVTTPTTATHVQATLSTLSTLAAGTYRVVVQRSDAVTADFPVTIGAVGPPGPAGVSVPVYQ